MQHKRQRERMISMRKRNNPYTAEEDEQIRSQIKAFKGKHIPSNIYGTLAWTMGNRHTVASLQSRASRLRHGRSGEKTEQGKPCNCECKQPPTRKQESLELYSDADLLTGIKNCSDTLLSLARRLTARIDEKDIIQQQQKRIAELEASLQRQAENVRAALGG